MAASEIKLGYCKCSVCHECPNYIAELELDPHNGVCEPCILAGLTFYSEEQLIENALARAR